MLMLVMNNLVFPSPHTILSDRHPSLTFASPLLCCPCANSPPLTLTAASAAAGSLHLLFPPQIQGQPPLSFPWLDPS